MPDDRIKRTRETLPKGYQFGDAGRAFDKRRGIAIRFVKQFDIKVDTAPTRFGDGTMKPIEATWKQQ